MASNNYDTDKLFWPITLTSTTVQLVVFEDNGNTESMVDFTTDSNIASFPATVYNHKDGTFASGAAVSHFAFLSELVDSLNNDTGLNNTYEITANTPTGSSLNNSGITITRATGTDNFSIRWTNGSTTLDPRLLGWGDSPSNTGYATSHDSPYSLWGVWQSPKAAQDKRREPRQIAQRSDGSSNAASVIWDTPLERRLEYSAIYGAHVWNDRADTAAFADDAGLPTNDVYNALYDLWFESARAGEQLLFSPDDGGDANWNIGTSYEWVVFLQSKRDNFWENLEDQEGGEKYKIMMAIDADRDSSTYSH